MIHLMIGCFSGANTGKGGHYYSLLHLKQAMKLPSVIVVVGDFFPSVYEGVEGVIFIYCSRKKLFFLSDYTARLNHKPRLIHSFDRGTASYGSKIAKMHRIPFVITKPGGPIQSGPSIPYRNQIVFHSEDFKTFNSLRRKPDRLELIPHRVPAVSETTDRLDPFSCIAGPNDLKLICISRIGTYYVNKLTQTIKLFDRLSETRNCALVIIGTVEDNSVLNMLSENLSGKKAVIHTDNTFTHNAAELLTYADVAIAGGRSLMEAMSLGMYVFFPVRDSEIPCFAEEKNFDEAMAHNFSERIELSQAISPEAGLMRFLRSDTIPSYCEEYACWARGKFTAEFDVRKGAYDHEVFYRNSVLPESSFVINFNRLAILLHALVQTTRATKLKKGRLFNVLSMIRR